MLRSWGDAEHLNVNLRRGRLLCTPFPWAGILSVCVEQKGVDRPVRPFLNERSAADSYVSTGRPKYPIDETLQECAINAGRGGAS